MEMARDLKTGNLRLRVEIFDNVGEDIPHPKKLVLLRRRHPCVWCVCDLCDCVVVVNDEKKMRALRVCVDGVSKRWFEGSA